MTLSIVAFDPDARVVGAAVTTCQLAGGRRIIQVRPGVGAVAAQDGAEIPWREAVLDRLAEGASTEEAIAPFSGNDVQLAAVSLHGSVSVWTGPACGPPAGHCVGDMCSAQANLAARPDAWVQMVRAFETAEGPLAERLVAALDASGGDSRGAQSAAVLVTGVEPMGGWPDEPHVDLRVDDHREPVTELRRLLALHRAHLALLGALDLGAAERVKVLRPLAEEHPDDPLLRRYLADAERHL